jgi:Fe-Mn family superoxide dismutase
MRSTSSEEGDHIMAFTLPDLPYSMDALAPVMSRETLEYHYGKHHRAYVNNLNKLVEGTDLAKKSLEEIVKQSPAGGIFNNAAQIWNHTFFWNCLVPKGSELKGPIKAEIERQFGSFDQFKTQFQDAAVTLFGSGWVWLSKHADGKLVIEKGKDADTPLAHGHTPLLTCDVWEHAYYIDYRNERAKFVTSFWGLVNWDFVNQQLAKAGAK